MTPSSPAHGNLLSRIAAAAPILWRSDRVFRVTSIGAGVTGVILLVTSSTYDPTDDRLTIYNNPANRQTWIGPRDRVTQARQPAAVPGTPTPIPSAPLSAVPKIAPGQALGSAMIAPSNDGDRFGTFKPGKQP